MSIPEAPYGRVKDLFTDPTQLYIRMTNNVLDFRYENPSDANDRISTTSDASIQSPVKKSEK